jgi:predicted dehydrogenase
MTRPWGVAILGLGHWYSAFGLARSLPEYPKATLVGAAWHDPRQLEAFTSTFRVPGHTDYDALLTRDDVDIVHIAAPVAEIPDLTIRAARAGKHIILGKPMAMTLAQADAMVAAVHEAQVTCVAFQGMMRLRAGPLRQRLERGEFGDLAVMHQTSRWSIAEDWFQSGTPGWFVDPAQVPGGAFIDEGIYWIDLFRWLAGSEIVRVDAKMANLVHKDLRVEDWGMAFFTCANGVMATLEASWTITAPRPTGPSPKQNSVVRFELVGTRGEYVDQWFRDPGRGGQAAGAHHRVVEKQAQAPV